MRQTLLTLVFAIVAVMGAWAQQVPQIVNVMNRQTQSLNGGQWPAQKSLVCAEGVVRGEITSVKPTTAYYRHVRWNLGLTAGS